MTMIDQRPAEAVGEQAGHWEGDLITGGVRPVGDRHLGGPASLYTIFPAPAAAVPLADLGPGQEDGAASELSAGLGMPVYFADPHSPWQRGTNENTYWCSMSGAGLFTREKPRPRAAG